MLDVATTPTVSDHPEQRLAPPTADARLAREAYELTGDLMRPRAAVYWLDLVLTAAVTWVSLVFAASEGPWPMRVIAGLAAVLALFRGISFIHEIAHIRGDELPGFSFGWNALLGVPFLAPSFLYEGVHLLHHVKDRYGTAGDPEYLPLSRYPRRRIAGFVLVAALAPLGVLLRFAVLAPLSLGIPALRRVVVGRLSAMSINPAFVREDGQRALGAAWRAQEIGCWLWSWTVLGLTFSGVLTARYLLTAAAILSIATLVNQLRTVVAHAWTSDGAKMSVLEQFRDSVNVPPPGWLPALWAPVGLRYHALHHLLPRLPYHHLGEAHRRLVAAFPATSAYHDASYPGLTHALGRLLGRAKDRSKP